MTDSNKSERKSHPNTLGQLIWVSGAAHDDRKAIHILTRVSSEKSLDSRSILLVLPNASRLALRFGFPQRLEFNA